jgi:hypothetical protein
MALKVSSFTPAFWLGVTIAVALVAFTYYWSGSLLYALAPPVAFCGLYASLRLLEGTADEDSAGLQRVSGKSAVWSAKMTLETPLPAAREAVAQAMHVLNRVKVRTSAPRIVEVRTGFSWASFGEVVRAELVEHRDSIEVQVVSRPALRTTLVDWGKNKRHLKAVMRALRTVTGGRPGAQWGEMTSRDKVRISAVARGQRHIREPSPGVTTGMERGN